jgi:hypothetical protein
MNNPDDLHSWSKLHREEAHQAAHRFYLAAHRARVGGEKRCGRDHVGLAWQGLLSLLRSARLSQ